MAGTKFAQWKIDNMIFKQKREETKPTRLVSVSESVAFREFLFSFRETSFPPRKDMWEVNLISVIVFT